MTLNGEPDLEIGPGHYWVDGILCELPQVVDGGGNPVPMHYSAQPNFPLDHADLPAAPYLVYLDVWERHVSALEDPSAEPIRVAGRRWSGRSK